MSLLRTPLYQWHLDRKARLVPFGGWEMPVQYTSIIDEHKAVRSAVGLFDISHMARFGFAGADAGTLLDRLTTNNVLGMKVNQVRYSLICNHAGGIQDDVLVYRYASGWGLVVNASNRQKIADLIRAEIAGRDVRFTDHTDTTGMIAVQGPKAVGLVAGLFADDVSGLKYYFGMPTTRLGEFCYVSRTGYTGEDGLEIVIAADRVVALTDKLYALGALPCGLGARDTLRLEAGMPLYGHELREDIDPFQAGLGWAVKLEKGDFRGKAALVKRRAAADPLPQRVGLVLSGTRAAREGSPVRITDQLVGKVTSGSFAPWLGKSIAMAFLAPNATGVGTAVEVDIRGTLTPAHVVELPFYKRTV